MQTTANDEIKIRTATPEDAEALAAIYAPYVENTSITFEYTVPSVKEFAERIRHTLARYPYLVAEKSGIPIGYAYASAFKGRALTTGLWKPPFISVRMFEAVVLAAFFIRSWRNI